MPANKLNKWGVLLPPAVGYSLRVFFKILVPNKVSFRYFPRLFITILINLINLPFRSYERIFINPKFNKTPIENDPIFIIGHWRSGTTHLHNILCQDPQMGYVSTYQGVFPDTLFNKVGWLLFKSFTKLLIPGRRKGDNVVMDASFPQEEEFALGTKTLLCYYYFWLFPRKINEYYDAFVRLRNIDTSRLESWKDDYKILIKKALKKTQGTQFLSKNPPNTGRIKVLAETFPNAKFIFIHRNPVEVFLSTRNFFDKMMPSLQLQTISDDEKEEFIFEIYTKLIQDYLSQKKLIKAGNLYEISFEDFEMDPVKNLGKIYEHLGLKDFEKSRPLFEDYVKQTMHYNKNKHSISSQQLQKVLKRWEFAMKTFKYTLPKNIEITDE